MDDNFMARLDEEEAVLQAKLAAVQHMKAVYRGDIKLPASPAGRPAVSRPAQASTSRIDKFGAYGHSVIEAALHVLPHENDRPMATRDVLAKIEAEGIEVRGANQINALSALLARSSKIKGHGRSGWTKYGQRPDDPLGDELKQDDDFAVLEAAKENEPHSSDAGGSDAVSSGVPPLDLTQVHSDEGAQA